MKLIVGLGNPGEQYEKTRHNLGFMVLEQFLKDFEPVKKTVWEDSKKFKGDIVELEWQPKHPSARSGQVHLEKVILLKPKTFMNNSGLAATLVRTFYKIAPSDIWVIHDDIDLQLGSVRIRKGGSSAGHRGVESMLEHLKTDLFWRFRLGIGHPKGNGSDDHKRMMHNVDDFVLGDFTASEKGKLKNLIRHSAKAISCALEDGLDIAMNKCNTK